jgi:Nodulation protein Z (NodZ)
LARDPLDHPLAHEVRAVTRGRYVVVKGRFGMGGRIAVMMSALRYARATARELIVDWNDFAYYSPAVGDVFSALFERPVTSLRPLSELRGLSVHPEAWSDLLEAYRDDLNAEIMPYELSFCPPPEDDSNIDADVVVVTRNTANRRIRASYRELCPRGLVTDFASDFKHRVFRESMIGVHVRHGNGERCFRPPDLSWFREQVAELRAAAPEHGLFLCTDSGAVLEKFRAIYPDLASTCKWYPDLGAGPLHQNPGCPDRFRNAVEALIDIWLLKDCASLVLSPGFFGRTARYLAGPAGRWARVYPHRIHPTPEDKAGWDNPI